MYRPKHENAARKKAWDVSLFLKRNPNATLKSIATNFERSTTWASLYKKLAKDYGYMESYRDQQKARIHKSHKLSKERAEILAPAGTPRFYGVRTCKGCKYEVAEHPAGLFIDAELFEPCYKETEDD